jgi:hypothetical protein
MPEVLTERGSRGVVFEMLGTTALILSDDTQLGYGEQLSGAVAMATSTCCGLTVPEGNKSM